MLTDEEVRAIFEKLAEPNLPRFFEFLFLLAGELAQVRGYFDALLMLASRMVETKRSGNAHVGLPDMLYLLGVAHEGLGHVDEARAAYDEARQRGENLGLRRSLWPILARLAPLEAAVGNGADAKGHWATAREIVEHIAKNTGAADLTASFRALPEVRDVLRA